MNLLPLFLCFKSTASLLYLQSIILPLSAVVFSRSSWPAIWAIVIHNMYKAGVAAQRWESMGPPRTIITLMHPVICRKKYKSSLLGYMYCIISYSNVPVPVPVRELIPSLCTKDHKGNCHRRCCCWRTSCTAYKLRAFWIKRRSDYLHRNSTLHKQPSTTICQHYCH